MADNSQRFLSAFSSTSGEDPDEPSSLQRWQGNRVEHKPCSLTSIVQSPSCKPVTQTTGPIACPTMSVCLLCQDVDRGIRQADPESTKYMLPDCPRLSFPLFSTSIRAILSLSASLFVLLYLRVSLDGTQSVVFITSLRSLLALLQPGITFFTLSISIHIETVPIFTKERLSCTTQSQTWHQSPSSSLFSPWLAPP